MSTQLVNSSEQLNDLSGGWIPQRNITWIRTGNHTLLVAGNMTGTYQPGTKIWYTDNGVGNKYGVIATNTFTSGTTTTFNLIPNTDFIASGTISNPYISYINNPVGFPQSFTWTPVWGSLIVGNGTLVSEWTLIGGNVVRHYVNLTFGNTSSITGTVTISNPYTPSIISIDAIGYGFARDAGVAQYQVQVYYPGIIQPMVLNSAGTYATQNGITSTIPMTWGTNDQLSLIFDFPL